MVVSDNTTMPIFYYYFLSQITEAKEKALQEGVKAPVGFECD